MYQRLDIDTIQELHKEYAKDRLFQNLYSAISAVCTKTDDITAEEIWKLAGEYVRQIVQTENDLFEIDALPSKLYHLLSKYQEGTTVVIRSKEDIERTVFFVRRRRVGTPSNNGKRSRPVIDLTNVLTFYRGRGTFRAYVESRG